MTTEELIKQLNVNGWTNSSLITEEKGQDYISICAPFNDEVMEVPVDATNWLNVKLDYFEVRDSLTGVTREYVSSLVSQYLNTPIGERKPEKKYRLRWLDSDDPKLDHETYLGRDYPDSGGYNWVTCNKDMAEVFTEHELEKLKDENADYAMIIDAMKEEVKDDD